MNSSRAEHERTLAVADLRPEGLSSVLAGSMDKSCIALKLVQPLLGTNVSVDDQKRLLVYLRFGTECSLSFSVVIRLSLTLYDA